MATDHQTELEQWEVRQEARRELVRAALYAKAERTDAQEVLAEKENAYAQRIADALKGGVVEADLRAMKLEVVEVPAPRKRASRSKKSPGAQPAPVEVSSVE